MSLSNEQLLYLSALAYYNVDTVDVSNKNVKNIINGVRKGEKTTCFDGVAGYTDKELGMDKIISFIENDSELSAARNVLNNEDGDIDITVCGHSTGGNQAQYVTIAYEKKYWT